MKSIILAAGYATRLYPLTENFPKPLLDVGGKPILDWLIDDLGDAIDEYVVVTNHKFADIFRDWAGKRANRITVIDDGTTTNETRLGAVKDIQLAAEELAEQTADTTKDEPILVMAGDNMLDFSLRGFVDYQQSIGTSCVMCHEEKELTALQKTAVITIDTDNTITSYEEKPKQPKGTLAVPPFYIYCSQDIARIQEALDDGCGYDAPGSFAAWLSTKTPLHAYVMPGKRYDIGDVASYERVKGVFTP
jgi:glucose-1-phosphate thymidylyltransferase